MKKIFFILLIAILILPSLSWCTTQKSDTEATNIPTDKPVMESFEMVDAVNYGMIVDYEENIMFNDFSVEVFFDDVFLFDIEQGKAESYNKEVSSGSHTIRITQKGDSDNFDEYNINIKNNTYILITIKAKWEGIKVNKTNELTLVEYSQRCKAINAGYIEPIPIITSSDNFEIDSNGVKYDLNDISYKVHELEFIFHSISIYKAIGSISYFAKIDYSVRNETNAKKTYYLRETGNMLGTFHTDNLSLNIGKNSAYKRDNYLTKDYDGGTIGSFQEGGPYYVQVVISDMQLKEPLYSKDYMQFEIYIQDESKELEMIALTINPTE